MPPLATSNRPTRCSSAPVKAPLRWPNSSLSMSVSGSAPQLMATNGSPARRALVVHGAGDQLLAGAGFAEDQHGGLRRGDLGDQRADLAPCRRSCRSARGVPSMRSSRRFSARYLLRELALFLHAAQQRFDLDQLARLGEIVERAVPQGGDRRFERATCR